MRKMLMFVALLSTMALAQTQQHEVWSHGNCSVTPDGLSATLTATWRDVVYPNGCPDYTMSPVNDAVGGSIVRVACQGIRAIEDWEAMPGCTCTSTVNTLTDLYEHITGVNPTRCTPATSWLRFWSSCSGH